jgi:hypothetical protein
MSERQRWSHSAITRLTRCGEAYRREYVEKQFLPPTSSMARGTAVHHVVAEGHIRQINAMNESPKAPLSLVLRESLPSVEEAGDLAATRFEQERKLAGMVAPVDETEAPSVIIGRDKDAAVRMSRFYVGAVAPYRKPLYVERKIVVEPKNLPIRISGIIDLGTAEAPEVEGQPDREVVWDVKTGERKPHENVAHESDQLTMYALLRKLETGKIPDGFGLDYLVQEKKAFMPPYRVQLQTKRTQDDVSVMVNRLNNAIDAVQRGAFVANGPGNWYCSAKWCRFFADCRYVRRR